MRHTHALIKIRLLRRLYAEELEAMRIHTPIADRRSELFVGTCFGLESGFWKMQRSLLWRNLKFKPTINTSNFKTQWMKLKKDWTALVQAVRTIF